MLIYCPAILVRHFNNVGRPIYKNASIKINFKASSLRNFNIYSPFYLKLYVLNLMAEQERFELSRQLPDLYP